MANMKVAITGKGGVGKTVASCLTAVWLAQQGHKTLLLTTDPAAHLGDVLGQPVGDMPMLLTGVQNLWAVKIDPKAAAETYKTRILDDARQRGRPERESIPAPKADPKAGGSIMRTREESRRKLAETEKRDAEGT